MDYDDFIWFIKEREKIRFQKDIGLPRPWTTDSILDRCHTINIHTQYDAGTIRLHNYISGLSDWEKLFYIFVYRTCYSNPKTLKRMTGVWIHDYRNLKMLNWGIYTDYQPYSFFIGNHTSLDQFLLTIVLPVMKQFWSSFNRYVDEAIIDVEEELSILFSLQPGRRQMKLLTSILVQDMALQFPERINPDSKCYLSITSRQALKKLPGGRSNRTIEKLLDLTGLNYSSLNRLLSLWYSYLTRKEYFERHGFLRDEWLIKTT